ncbi:MAG: cell division protein [Legionella sp.]|nr:MAG: cell division protein [Legionella sp.]
MYMLKRDHVFVVAHQEALQRSVRFLFYRPWSTFMTIMMIAVTLMLASLSWMGTHHITDLRGYWQGSEHISLYLRHTLTPTEQQQFLSQVGNSSGVAAVTFTSSEEGLRLLSQQDGMQDMMQYLPNNPLPAMIEVTPSAALTTPESVDHLFQTLRVLPQVEDAKFDLDWMGRLYSVMGFFKQLSRFLMILLAMTAMLVIGNTLRLIIQHRQEEIQVLQLLGAADTYIMRPFLYSGTWYGFVSACLAIVLVDVFLVMLRTGLNQWAEVYQMHFSLSLMPFSVMFGLILVASALGWMSARITVSRYL